MTVNCRCVVLPTNAMVEMVERVRWLSWLQDLLRRKIAGERITTAAGSEWTVEDLQQRVCRAEDELVWIVGDAGVDLYELPREERVRVAIAIARLHA